MINPYHLQIGVFTLINILMALSVYIPLSTGQLSLGSAGFMATGAYVSALLATNFPSLPLPVCILFGALLALILSLIVGYPALRLKGVYLTIATLGFGEILRVLLVNNEWLTKGAIGISSIPSLARSLYAVLGNTSYDNFTAMVLLFLFLFLLLAIILYLLKKQEHSFIGRAFRAIASDEMAAQSSGIHLTRYKLLAFAEGAFLAGLAGALFAHTTSYISPADFTYQRSIEVLTYVVLGGTEVIAGPLLGAVTLTLFPEVLRFLAEYRYLIYGTLLIVLMAYRPQGLLIRRFDSQKKDM